MRIFIQSITLVMKLRILVALNLLVSTLMADFTVPEDLYIGSNISEVIVTDLNSDSKKDIVFVENSTIKVIYQDASAGAYRSALLDGKKHFVVPDNPTIKSNSFTWSTWFNSQEENDSWLYLCQSDTFDVRISPTANHIRFRLNLADGSVISLLKYGWKPDLATWYHVAFSYDSTTGVSNCYINGQLILTKTVAPSDVEASSDDFVIGGLYTGTSVKGYVDDTAYYNAALTATEIGSIYNFRDYVDLSNHIGSDRLVSWWTMGDSDEDEFSLVFGTQLLKDVAGSNDAIPMFTVREDQVEESYVKE